MKKLILLSLSFLTAINTSFAMQARKSDIIETSAGKLSLTFLGHASLLMEFKGKIILVDPWNEESDYSNFLKADLILITHEHPDHLNKKALAELSKPEVEIICTQSVFDIIGKGSILKNGESKTWGTIKIDAVPAYNTSAGKEKYHPKGRGNGYLLTIGDKKIYIAGDTEDIPEMKALKGTNIAILPMNQPYTMTPEQVLNATTMIHPSILYPYHTTEADLNTLTQLMSTVKNVEVRIRTNK